MTGPVDAVVVGLGAAGGVVAAQLAHGGLNVLGLEAGGHLDRTQFPPDQLATDMRAVLSSGKTRSECPTVRHSPDAVAEVPQQAALMMNAVGGTKHHSGNAHSRMPEWQFRSLTATVERYGQDAIPPGSTLADWPISYADLAPFYDEVEKLIGVSGDAEGNPFQGPRNGPYPLPPLRPAGYTELMAEAARGLGWHPFAAPAAIRSQAYHGMGGCTYCGHCVFNGCWADAKGVSSLSAIPTAQATGKLTVLTEARVVEILVDNDGLASGVVYLKDGERHVQHARAVVLSSFTYENVRLLLLSKSDAFPDGLSNRAGQVGRHFTTHQIGFSFGTFHGREMNTWTGSMSQAMMIADFDADNFDHADLGFVGGGGLWAMMEKKVLVFSRTIPPSVPRWGSRYKRWLAEDFRSVGHINIIFDEQPNEGTLLDLDPTHSDDAGYPVIRITRAPSIGDDVAYEFLSGKAEEWLRAAGATETWSLPYIPFNVSPHAFGGARMGSDASMSVVDPWCMSHEVPNLAVLGGAVFPSSTGSNPTPTIEALAWRTARHLVDQWDAIAAPARSNVHA